MFGEGAFEVWGRVGAHLLIEDLDAVDFFSGNGRSIFNAYSLGLIGLEYILNILKLKTKNIAVLEYIYLYLYIQRVLNLFGKIPAPHL